MVLLAATLVCMETQYAEEDKFVEACRSFVSPTAKFDAVISNCPLLTVARLKVSDSTGGVKVTCNCGCRDELVSSRV